MVRKDKGKRLLYLDHFYVTVGNLDLAIRFYERLLGRKVTNKEGGRWADFEDAGKVYLGLISKKQHKKLMSKENAFRRGTNVILALYTPDIKVAYKHIKNLDPKPSYLEEITIMSANDEQPYEYKVFQFKDPWGNLWEVAEYLRIPVK